MNNLQLTPLSTPGGSLTHTTKHDYYTVPKAARALSVSSFTVWHWVKSGKLRAYRVGERSIRIKSTDLESVISPVDVSEEQEPDIFRDYDPEAVIAALDRTAGSWSDRDAEQLIEEIYAAREEGSRPESRP